MSVIDLTAVRTIRRRTLEQVQTYVRYEAQHLIEEALNAADRAFQISGPLAQDEPDLSRAVNLMMHRRLRASLCRRLKVGFTVETRHAALDHASDLFRGRLLILITERDKRRGSA